VDAVGKLLPCLSRAFPRLGEREVIDAAQAHRAGATVEHVAKQPTLGDAVFAGGHLKVEAATVSVPAVMLRRFDLAGCKLVRLAHLALLVRFPPIPPSSTYNPTYK